MRSSKCRKKGSKRRLILAFGIFFLFLFSLSFVTATSVTFNSPTPSNNSYLATRNVLLNSSIITDGDLNFFRIQDNENIFNLFNDSLVLFWNFDNVSSLGENGTKVVDMAYGKFNLTNINNTPYSNTAGRYSSGAFQFEPNSTVGGIKYLQSVSSKTPITNQSNWTVSLWIYPNVQLVNYGATPQLMNLMGTYDGWFYFSNSTQKCYMQVRNGTDMAIGAVSNNCPFNTWSMFTVSQKTINATMTNYTTYKNGVFLQQDIVTGDIRGADAYIMVGAKTDYPQFYYLGFNGSLDDVIVFNQTLSAKEVSILYNSQLSKVNKTLNRFYYNRTMRSYQNLNLTIIVNDTNTQVTNFTRLFTLPVLSNVLINYSATKFGLSSTFYGVNIQNPNRIVGGYSMDKNCDGVTDSYGDEAWLKSSFENSKMTYARFDASLGTYYDGIKNPNFEEWYVQYGNSRWVNTSGMGFAKGFMGSTYSGANCTQFKTNDSHSGSWALNVTNVTGGGHCFIYNNGITTTVGKTYNNSIWLKGQGTVRITFKDIDRDLGCSASNGSIILSNTWKQYSVSCLLPSGQNSTDYSFIVDEIDEGENVSIDDFYITQDGANYLWYRKIDTTYNMQLFQQAVQYFDEQNKKMLIIMDYMPTFLNDWSSAGCNSSTSYCVPYNYTIWKDINKDFLLQVSSNHLYDTPIEVEVWNEPYGNFGNWSYDHVNRALDYIKVYNSSYDAIKEYNSNIAVFGPSGFRNAPMMTRTFLSNMTTKMDGVSIHPYGYFTTNYDEQVNDTRGVLALCAVYGANCSRIINSEYTVGSNALKNSTTNQSQYGFSLFYSLVSQANNYGNILSTAGYHWLDGVSYYNCPSRYVEYPSLWSYISEAGLDNAGPTYYPPYNVTRDLGKYCPASSTLYNITTSSYSYSMLGCKSPSNSYSFIIASNESDITNLTINTTGYFGYLMDIKTGALYDMTNGTINIGDIDSFDVKYLTTPTFELRETGLTYKNYYNETLGTGNDTWFSRSDTDRKSIASRLSSSQNMNVIVSGISCEQVTTIKYTPKGEATITWTGKTATDMCNRLTTDGLILKVNPSTSSNEMEFIYGEYTYTTNELCGDYIGGIAGLGNPIVIAFTLFGVLIVISAIAFLVLKVQDKDIDFGFDSIEKTSAAVVAVGVMILVIFATFFGLSQIC